MNHPRQPPGTVQTSQGPKRPTSARDGRRALRMAAAGAIVALAVVIAFNLMAPKGRLHAPAGTGSAPAMDQGAQQSGGPSGSVDPVQQAAPQRGDSPTAPGREAVGAPQGPAPGASQ